MEQNERSLETWSFPSTRNSYEESNSSPVAVSLYLEAGTGSDVCFDVVSKGGDGKREPRHAEEIRTDCAPHPPHCSLN